MKKIAGFFTVMICCSLFLVIGTLSGQEIDEAITNQQGYTDTMLRWYNIEKGDSRYTGPALRSRRKHNLHFAKTAPGETFSYLLPPYRILRLYSPGTAITPGDVEVTIRTAEGLSSKVPPRGSSDSHSLLVMPHSSQPLTIEVTRPAGGPGPIALALLVSQQRTIKKPPLYKPLAAQPGTLFTLTREGPPAVSGQWYFWPSGSQQELAVTGPTRLKIVTRMRFLETDIQLNQTYWLALHLNGTYHNMLEFHTGLETLNPLKFSGDILTAGRLRNSFIDIPEGSHKIRFTTSAAIYVQLEALTPEGHKVVTTAVPANKAEQRALRQVKDNRFRNNRIRAVAELLQAAESAPGNSQLQKTAQRFRLYHTHNRHLLPEQNPAGNATRPLFLRYRKHSGPMAPEAPSVFPRFTEALIARQGSGYFFPITFSKDATDGGAPYVPPGAKGGRGHVCPPSEPHLYHLPLRKVPSSLSIAVDTTGLTGSLPLYIRFDDDVPKELSVIVPEISGTGAAETPLYYLLPELKPVYTRDVPGPWLERAAVIELPLPAGVRTIRLWQEANSSTPLRVALRYRTSGPWQMSENQYNFALKQLPPEKRNIQRLLAAPTANNTANNTAGENAFESFLLHVLEMHHLPLKRFLNSRYLGFKSNLENNTNSGYYSSGKLRKFTAEKLRKESAAYMEKGQWLQALENWNTLLYKGTPKYRQPALWGRTAALKALKEYYLYEAQLKSILFHEKDPESIQKAFLELETFYKEQNRVDRLLTLAAVKVLVHPSPANLRHLEQRLRENRKEKQARQLALYTAAQTQGLALAPRTAEPPTPFRVTGCAGGVTLYSRGSDSYMTRYLITPKQRLTMQVEGPINLKCLFRPLHPLPKPADAKKGHGIRATATPVDDWITLELDEENLYYPINLNMPNTTMEMVGFSDRLPGSKEEFNLYVPPGRHQLHISTANNKVTAGFAAVTAEENKESETRMAVLREMGKLVMRAESQSPTAAGALASAGALFNRHPEIPQLQPFYKRLLRRSQWELLKPSKSGGVFPVSVKGWNPTSPYTRIRRSLLPPFGTNDVILTGTQGLEMELAYLSPRHVQLSLQLFTPDFQEPGGISVQCRAESRAGRYVRNRTVQLNSAAGTPDTSARTPGMSARTPGAPAGKTVSFSLPAGRFTLMVSPGKLPPNHYIRLRLREQQRGRMVNMPVEAGNRYFHVAYAHRPLQFNLPTPAWLRLDQWSSPGLETHYMYPPQGGDSGTFTIKPGDFGQAQGKVARLRVSRRVEKPAGQPPLQYLPLVDTPFALSFSPLPAIQGAPVNRPVILSDGISPGGQEDGTLSFTSGWRRFLPLEEDDEDGETADEYMFVSLAHRFYNAGASRYSRNELHLRYRSEGGPSALLRHWRQYRPGTFVLTFSATAVLQYAEGEHENDDWEETGDGEDPGDGENPGIFEEDDEKEPEDGEEEPEPVYFKRLLWNLTLQARFQKRLRLGKHMAMIPGLRLFGRYINLDEDDEYGSWDYFSIDRNIYSRYKENHKYGLSLENYLYVNVSPDTRFWVSMGLLTNQDFNPGSPDKVSLITGLKQRLGWLQLETRYRYARYFRDDHRSKARNRSYLRAALSRDIWTRGMKRWQVRALFTRYLERKHNTISLSLSYHLGKGRGYRDFDPSATSFKARKEGALARRPGIAKNTIKE
ncbi:MAG: hypothetical protein GY757_54495 [bacterium]|nr:hypothetical protein [bacterium]